MHPYHYSFILPDIVIYKPNIHHTVLMFLVILIDAKPKRSRKVLYDDDDDMDEDEESSADEDIWTIHVHRTPVKTRKHFKCKIKLHQIIIYNKALIVSSRLHRTLV
jgi:hypothetical protein